MSTSEKEKNINKYQNENPDTLKLIKRLINMFSRQDKLRMFRIIYIKIKYYFFGPMIKNGKNKKIIKRWNSFKPYKINEFFFSKN